MTKAYPYKVELLRHKTDTTPEVWWPVSSDDEDNMIVGDGIPGDKQTAEFAARCCNIVYRQAVFDVLRLINSKNNSLSLQIEELFQK